MEDITPGLIEAITEDFRNAYGTDKRIRSLLEKVREGTATYAEAQTYSIDVSRIIGEAYQKNVSSAVLPDGRMYYNIASRLIPSTMDDNYNLVSDYAAAVQKRLNEKAKIGIKVQIPEENQDRVDGLVEMVSNAEQYDRVSRKLLDGFENFCLNIVDESIKANAEFQSKAGLHPRIVRKSERKCCEWCANLAGEYEYPDVPHDVYRRHANCRCRVTYDPADGKGKYQDVWTKKWTEPGENGILEARKTVGTSSLVRDLAQHPGRLAAFTPDKIKAELENEGFEVKPLKLGSLKNVPFEDGGGFKVNFEDGGLFQYHPAEGSHHGGAYYKISTGKGGKKRYGLDGTEKRDE